MYAFSSLIGLSRLYTCGLTDGFNEWVFLAGMLLPSVYADDAEKRLINNLLANYDKRLRPTANASKPLNVTFGLALAQLIDVVGKILCISI